MARSKKAQKVPVSERALVARINRILDKKREALRRCRADSRGRNYLGQYYTVDLSKNFVIAKHVDIESWGRKLEILAPYEALEVE